jgi:hypothetical protein
VATYDYQFRVSGARVIVTQESIANNFTGFLKDIGSFDLNGDLFIFSTPQEELPEELGIVSVSSLGVVTTLLPHGLVSGNEVRLAGNGTNDGILLVQVVLTPTSAAGREMVAEASEGSTPVSPTPAKVRKTAKSPLSHL